MRGGTNSRRRLLSGLIGALGLGLAGAARPAWPAPEDRIAVVYPDLGEPYRSVFAKIIEGIEDKVRGRVASFAVGRAVGADQLGGELKRQNVRVVIALGRNGLKAVSSIDQAIEVIGGGVVSPHDAEARATTTISLAPDPSLLFERLKAIHPAVRRVTVVFEPRQNGWLIRLAQQAARQHGIELKALEANDLRSALRLYQEFFATSPGRADALWLPQDPTTVEDSTVLPLVLKESWNQNVAVFSSSLVHVRRGALFALYPDNLEMGRRLASSALGALDGGAAARGVVPLREVMAAVNSRTASHLGLNLGPGHQAAFNLILPEQ